MLYNISYDRQLHVGRVFHHHIGATFGGDHLYRVIAIYRKLQHALVSDDLYAVFLHVDGVWIVG